MYARAREPCGTRCDTVAAGGTRWARPRPARGAPARVHRVHGAGDRVHGGLTRSRPRRPGGRQAGAVAQRRQLHEGPVGLDPVAVGVVPPRQGCRTAAPTLRPRPPRPGPARRRGAGSRRAAGPATPSPRRWAASSRWHSTWTSMMAGTPATTTPTCWSAVTARPSPWTSPPTCTRRVGGYSWRKIPGARVSPADVDVYRVAAARSGYHPAHGDPGHHCDPSDVDGGRPGRGHGGGVHGRAPRDPVSRGATDGPGGPDLGRGVRPRGRLSRIVNTVRLSERAKADARGLPDPVRRRFKRLLRSYERNGATALDLDHALSRGLVGWRAFGSLRDLVAEERASHSLPTVTSDRLTREEHR